MIEKVYLDGKLMDATAARVSVSNPSFQHGVGLFETLRTYDGRAFGLQRHIARMRDSAQKLDMPIDGAIDQVEQAVQAVIAANGSKNARLRFTITPPGLHDDPPHPTLLVMAQETAGYPSELYERGMTACVADHCRQSPWDALVSHKTTSYYPRLVALRQAQTKGCGEALWVTPDHHLAEGSISNLFLVKDGRLRTPPLDTPVLPGITRAIILELAKTQGIAADETPCTIDDLLDADEVFLTNAIMEVMPVTRVERRGIKNERPGTITKQLAENYRKLTQEEGPSAGR